MFGKRFQTLKKSAWATGVFLTAFATAAGAPAGSATKEMAVIASPDGRGRVEIYFNDPGRLSYELFRDDRLVVEKSPLGIIVDGVDLGSGVEPAGSFAVKTVNETSATRGKHPVAADHCNTAAIPLRHQGSGKAWQLELRVYDDGLAFRYIVPGQGSLRISGESTGFQLPSDAALFFQQNTKNGEGIYRKQNLGRINSIMGIPVTAALPENAGYLAITEAAVYNYSGMTLQSANDRVLRAIFEDDQSWTVEADSDSPLRSPWRGIMVAKDLNGLVNCDIAHNLSPAPSPELFPGDLSWIQPGRALWSWWSEGTGDLARQKRYADAAQKLGFEYILVDEGWERWAPTENQYWAMIKELVDYAGDRGVKVWVWKHYGKLMDEKYRADFFRKVKAAGVVGVKIDFMDSESQGLIRFYQDALEDAAEYKLMVNFHGANKPAGESRTYPNEMTREGLRGLEYNRGIIAPNPASYNATLPFTRFLAGHGDYTPVTFNYWKMGKTSSAHQLATAIVFTSPITHYADKPENFLANPKTAPALPVIKAIPTVWDETIVLPGSEIGELAAFARRSGKTWFIGVLNGGDRKTIRLRLDFLPEGKYQAILLSDHPYDKTGLSRVDQTVSAGDELEINMRRGGGFVAMIKSSG